MNDKPKESLNLTKWKLVSMSKYSEFIEDYAENNTEFQSGMEVFIKDQTILPELINNILYYIAEAEGIEDSIANEIRILRERQERFSKRTDNLRETIQTVFDRYDIKKLECPYGTVSQVNKPAFKLEITDEGNLLMNHPDLYIKQDPMLDRAKLKARLRAGEVIDGAKLVDSKNIMIRK